MAEVLEIHQDQIVRYGSEPGTRDPGLLELALAMPAATVHGAFPHVGIFEMAAAYLFHIVRKRAGAVAAIVFPSLNGYDFNTPAGALYEFVMALAHVERTKADSAIFFRERCERV